MREATDQIIALLRHEGRLPFRVIAEQLGVSREYVAARVRSLIESKRLRIVAGVHPLIVGLPVSAHLAIRSHSSVELVAAQLKATESLSFVSETTGGFQFVAELRASSTTELRRKIVSIRALTGVADVQVHVYNDVRSSFFGGGAPAIDGSALDRTDRELLNLLQQDGRMPYRDLAQRLGLSASACRSRALRLQKFGVMKIGAIDDRTGSARGLLFGFGVNVLDDAVAEEVIMAASNSVEFLAQTLGRFDLVATVGFSNIQQFHDFVRTLHATEAIASVESWLHADIILERYEQPVPL